MSVVLARRPGGFTLADLMRVRRITMREAIAIAKDLEAKGLVVRSGGGPGEAFRWVKK